MGIKAREFADGYVSFMLDAQTGKWRAFVTNWYDPKQQNGPIYYRIKIPVPEELILQELPNQAQIEVTE